MPVLAAETDLYPEQLLDEVPPPDLAGRLWWVMHVKPRQEKSLARHLLTNSIPFYLPQVERRVRSRGRVQTSYLPLFSSYVFVLGTATERIQALTSNRVVRTLEVGDQRQLWADLAQIRRLVSTGLPIASEETLAPGQEVEIRSGPLAGLKGRIVRAASGHRFVVQVNFIQRGASILLNDCDLQALS